jgi:hypothetical protein
LLNNCPSSFVTNLYRALKGENVEGLEDAQSLTKTYHWLFTDIVGGSNPTTPTREQVSKIVGLNELMARTETFSNREVASTIILPVGDGVAVGFPDTPEKPLHLATELHKALFRYNQTKPDKEKIIIRIGIDMGPVYFVKDLNGKDNVWGPGIILTRRVMDLCGEMNIFASARIAHELLPLSPEYKKILHKIGDFHIKHGEELSIYNVYGDGFGNRRFPRKKKVLEPDLQRDSKAVNNFSFNEIDLKLEVLSPKTHLMRHTQFWDVVNISKANLSQIFYFIDGDTSKDFSDLNISTRDGSNNPLEILAVNANKPTHKEFNVQLNRPVLPKKRRTLIMEYDWEEPYRVFFFRFASGCKKFNYSLIAPSGYEIKPKISQVDAASGAKTEVNPPPNVSTVNRKTVVSCKRNDLQASETFQFDW